MQSNEEKRERVILAGVHTGERDALQDTTDNSIEELGELVKTAGGDVVGIMVQNKRNIEAAAYMGEGKIEELRIAINDLAADCVVFDDELSPMQIRNLSDLLGAKILDRSMLILDIFAMHAKSGEGKLQVELAQLKYRLPRLRGLGVQLSRTGAGIGTRGPGETKLESDRRHIHRRISTLERELTDLSNHRELIRSRRKKDGVITAALIGYTNAGKSSLLNKLTDASVLAEDKLFATLDTTSRGVTLEDNRKILLCDTVGFIRKLPHHLVEAFKSTLEEAVVADVLLHVIDASSDEMNNQICVVEHVMMDIGAVGKPIIAVYNKCDKIEEKPQMLEKYDKTVYISAKSGDGLDDLMNAISDVSPGKKRRIEICIPYNEGALVNEIHEKHKVLSEEYTSEGTLMTILADSAIYERVKIYEIGGA
jgi:GTP-binding protein HflX